MDRNNKILLNKEKSVLSVNITEEVNIKLDNTTKPLPLSDEQHTVSAFEQFEKERQESTIYRFYGVINPLICNPLYNSNIHVSGATNPNIDPIGITIPADSIFDKNGWLGYFDDNFTEDNPALCQFKPFDAGHDRLEIVDPDGNPNYMLKITYPYATKDISLVNGTTLADGIPVIEKIDINIHDRSYTGFRTPINHGLTVDDEIKMYNFQDLTSNNYLGLNTTTVKVHKLGNSTNDELERIFVVDINPLDIDISVGLSTIKRSVRDTVSDYYVRVFSALTTDYVDYEIYPAAYGVNYFYDKEAAFYFKKDIDVKDIRDNLGRPLSELFLTIIKNDEDADITSPNHIYWMNRQQAAVPPLDPQYVDRFWMPLVAGYKTEKSAVVNYNIRGVGADPSFDPEIPQIYFENNADPNGTGNLDESNNAFDGDIVEYNSNELTEIPLEEIYHRFNSVFREFGASCNDIPSLAGLETMEQRMVGELLKDNKEGYIYLPHRRIEIRAFSTFIEEGDSINTLGIPDYATLKYSADTQLITTGPITTIPLTKMSKFYKWRDLLDIGYMDNDLVGVDYPFESGAHYINIVTRFYLQRQDPPCNFALIGFSFEIPHDDNNVNTMPTFVYLSSLPTYFDYTFSDPSTVLGDTGEESELQTLNPTTISVRMLEYYGEYNLGPRSTPGGCVSLNIIETKTIDDEC